MVETVLFESERIASRATVAEYLRTVAESLDTDEAVTLTAGEESVTLDPPAQVEFEVKAEREGPADGSGELSLELELEWDENGGSEDLEIS